MDNGIIMAKIKIELSINFDITPWLEECSYYVEGKTVCRIPGVNFINENGVTTEFCNAINQAIEDKRKKLGLPKLKWG